MGVVSSCSQAKRHRNRRRCLSSRSRCPSAQSVENPSMPQRRSWLVDTSGILGASSAPCATRCWTAPTATKETRLCSARRATDVGTGPKVTDSEGGQGLSTWTLANSLETLSSRTTNPLTPPSWPNSQFRENNSQKMTPKISRVCLCLTHNLVSSISEVSRLSVWLRDVTEDSHRV